MLFGVYRGSFSISCGNFFWLTTKEKHCCIASAGAITTLGRGGSDLSATVIGAALGLDEVQVWKDVDGEVLLFLASTSVDVALLCQARLDVLLAVDQ